MKKLLILSLSIGLLYPLDSFTQKISRPFNVKGHTTISQPRNVRGEIQPATGTLPGGRPANGLGRDGQRIIYSKLPNPYGQLPKPAGGVNRQPLPPAYDRAPPPPVPSRRNRPPLSTGGSAAPAANGQRSRMEPPPLAPRVGNMASGQPSAAPRRARVAPPATPDPGDRRVGRIAPSIAAPTDPSMQRVIRKGVPVLPPPPLPPRP